MIIGFCPLETTFSLKKHLLPGQAHLNEAFQPTFVVHLQWSQARHLAWSGDVIP
jgi:hypothetical protein